METFKLLWKMHNEANNAEPYRGRDQTGAVISRYAGIIDDRIENSGYSRNTDSLKLWTTEQLQEELTRRENGDAEEDE